MSNLQLDQVSYRYRNGDRQVVNNVSCSFEGGKLSAVVGPSGSGKTTLLSLMAGLDQPTQGRLLINGVDLATIDLDLYRRERVAMIFQAFHLFPLLTVLENVSFPLELNGVSKKEAAGRAKELLVSVGIGEEKHKRYPANLSGGEQQRVAIARALANGSRVVLADEPTGNLDKANGENVIEILQQLAHQQRYCIVVVTHNLEIAERSDKVWSMSDGVLTEQIKQMA
jgi:putative ABC transport system ATP-binding protein